MSIHVTGGIAEKPVGDEAVRVYAVNERESGLQQGRKKQNSHLWHALRSGPCRWGVCVCVRNRWVCWCAWQRLFSHSRNGGGGRAGFKSPPPPKAHGLTASQLHNSLHSAAAVRLNTDGWGGGGSQLCHLENLRGSSTATSYDCTGVRIEIGRVHGTEDAAFS